MTRICLTAFFLIPLLSATSFALAAEKVSFSATTLKQGDTLFIKVEGAANVKNIVGIFGEKRFGFFKPKNSSLWIGMLGIDVKETSGKRDVALSIPGAPLEEQKIKIIRRKFPITELLVTQKLKEKGVTPSKIVQGVGEENKALQKIMSVYTKNAYFSKPFLYPLEKIKDVGAFGNIRKNGTSIAQHLGVDLDAPLDTPVYAANDGMVAFSQGLPTYGKTLVIDHGLGIFSLYLHLNEFKAAAGQRVARGDIVGLSGNTGYSIEPHLHFSIKINSANVDPLKFIETMQKITGL